MKYSSLILLLLICISLVPGTCFAAEEEEISLEEIAVTGVDRSTFEFSPDMELVKLEKEKIVIGERTGSAPPFSLGAFSVWATMLIGTNDLYEGSLLSGLTGSTLMGDLQLDYTKSAGRRENETAAFGGGSVLLSKVFSSDLEIRLTSSIIVGQYDLLGAEEIARLSDRKDESYKIELEVGYPVSDNSSLYIGFFYDFTEIERSALRSERKMGVTLTLDSEKLDVTFRGWSYSFSKGDEEGYATLESRFTELYRRRELIISGSLGLNLIDGEDVSISPKLSVAWKPAEKLKLVGNFGIDHKQPSMNEEVLLIPEIDPFEKTPDTIRESFANITAYLGLSRMSEVRLCVDFRDTKNSIYYGRGADGYFDILTMDSCSFITTSAQADVWLSEAVKVFGSFEYTYANPEGGFSNYPYLPKSKTSLGVSVSFLKHWVATTELQYKGKVYTRSLGNDQLDSFVTLNAELSYKLEDYLSFFIRATNITNEDYYDFEGWNGYERAVKFGFEVTF